MNAPTRPALRYMGGKWRLAPKILPFFPPHRTYVEPFGGAASVLLQKPRAHCEIYNDLDGAVVNLFRVLRDPAQAAQLLNQLELTPFARGEFEEALQPCDQPVEAARRMLVRSFMAHGSTGLSPAKRTTGFRADSTRPGKDQAENWRQLPDGLRLIIERLAGVVIENQPALQLLDRVDRADVLVYADPPYVPSTRVQRKCRGALEHAYRHELTIEDHEALLTRLRGLTAMVIVSGYPSGLYDELLAGWERVEMRAFTHIGTPRTEVIWINQAAVDAAGGLFALETGRG